MHTMVRRHDVPFPFLLSYCRIYPGAKADPRSQLSVTRPELQQICKNVNHVTPSLNLVLENGFLD